LILKYLSKTGHKKRYAFKNQMNKTDAYDNQIRLLKKKERFLISVSIILSLIIIALIIYSHQQSHKNKEEYPEQKQAVIAPYPEKVHAIIEKLKYSGIEMFVRDDVTLNLDFKNNLWTLNNLHRFDQAGNLILENGTNGTCGELAAYAYEKIKPLFGDRYEIKFVKSAQSGFFLSSRDSHITLYIKEKSSNPSSEKVFIIDPSFHRYGHISEFEDYLFTDSMESLPFIEKKETSADIQIHSALPLFIGGDYLLGFAVERNNGVFDKQNFILALILTKKYKFSGRYLFAIRNNNGKAEKFENRMLIKHVLSKKEYEGLVAKIMLFFKELTR